MPIYDVTITRTAFATHTFRVQADHCEEAKQRAYDDACNFEFTEYDAEYDIDLVLEVVRLDDERSETP